MSDTGTSRPWHAWYQRFAPTSPEVMALQVLEPVELQPWTIKLRQEFPTVPPNGIEMCHARWLETIDRLIADIGDSKFSRRSHWCGDIPAETIAGLGLRRRVLQAWLKNSPREQLLGELAEGLGRAPDIADLLFDLLGDMRSASQAVRQDVEVLADMFSGPFEAGNAPIMAKWRARYEGLRERNSVLSQLGERYFPVLTNLCNYRTLTDADRLIGMVARQSLETEVLGPCNWSLKFMLHDEPERLSASLAAVWALHRYAATDFHEKIEPAPLGVRDQMNAFEKRLGNPDDTKSWLAASLGFVIKKWVRRAWHIMEIDIPDGALPDFSFPYAVQTRQEGGNLVVVEQQQPNAPRRDTGAKHEVIAASSGVRRSKAPPLPGAPEIEGGVVADGAAETTESASQTPSGEGISDGEHQPDFDTLSRGKLPKPSIEDRDQSGDDIELESSDIEAKHADSPGPAMEDDWERPKTIGGTTRILTPAGNPTTGNGDGGPEQATHTDQSPSAAEPSE